MRQRPPAVSVACALALAAGALAVGCTNKSAKANTVTVTDTECTLKTTSLDPGDETFTVVNRASNEVEFYVYTRTGQKVDEVEHVAPGTSKTLRVQLEGGHYFGTCKYEGKPDIRNAFTVG